MATYLTLPTRSRRAGDPFQEIGTLQEELTNLLDATGFGRPFLSQRERRFPLLNIITTDKESILRAELPGVELKDLEISLTGTTLTIKGERKAEDQVPDEKYYQRERGAGPFGRTVELPHKVDADKVEASIKDGVLTIKLPKAPEIQPRQIEVKLAKK